MIYLLSIRFAFLKRCNLRLRTRCKQACIPGSSVCNASTGTKIQSDALRPTTYLDLGLLECSQKPCAVSNFMQEDSKFIVNYVRAFSQERCMLQSTRQNCILAGRIVSPPWLSKRSTQLTVLRQYNFIE